MPIRLPRRRFIQRSLAIAATLPALPRLARAQGGQVNVSGAFDPQSAVTYNQFVEGCLAFSGYRVWGELFDMFGVLPGMQEGLRLVRRDEGRHITYGTYLARRVVAAHPELLDFAKDRLKHLRDLWYRELTGMEPPAEKVDASGVTAQIEAARESGELPEGGEMLYMFKFFEYLDIQVEARSQGLERAARLSEEEAMEDAGAEEAEADLLGV
jgi:hypothetical protein